MLLIFLMATLTRAQGAFAIQYGSAKKMSLICADSVAKPVVTDSWNSPDKGQHLLGSMMLTIATAKSLQRFYDYDDRQAQVSAMTFTLSVGIGKEVLDYFRPGHVSSYKDLLADCLGVLLGQAILQMDSH